jgi:heme-degrading monooxygenase HmoA
MNTVKEEVMLKYVVVLVALSSGCEIAQPFQGPKWDMNKGLTDKSLKGPFLAATTDIIVKQDSAAQDLFNNDFNAIQTELKASPGLIGYSLDEIIGGDDYRTLTVWEDEQAMVDFVTGKAHAQAMSDATKIGQHGEVTTWNVELKDMPPTFDDAKRELAKQGTVVVK